MTHIKICGIKRPVDALAAVEAGADLIGVVLAPSKRQVDEAAGAEIVAALDGRVPVVGVFVNERLEEVNRIARTLGLSYAQLSGDESEEVVARVELPVIQVLRVHDDEGPEDLAERIGTSAAQIVLLDTARPGSYGGTGETFRWETVPRVDRPLMVAGGLHSGNVLDAIRVTSAWGVDVSSGVETEGEKDHARIREFVAAVRGI